MERLEIGIQCGTGFNSIGSQKHTHTHSKQEREDETAAGTSPPRNSHMTDKVVNMCVCVCSGGHLNVYTVCVCVFVCVVGVMIKYV